MKLTKRHRTAIELLIEGELSIDEIAQNVKTTRQTLYNWRKDADFEQEYNEQLNEIERRTKRRISRMVDTALERQERILTKSRNDNAAAMVAKDVLDRAGYAPDSNINVNAEGVVQIIDDIPRGESDGKAD
ncbi:helix-turn-helix domain-containing protein [Lachnospiraceae bacterium MD329]|nr:helix-turn-helix domain-containing protein [Lachnospiraceae bacterium MD329]